jgi:hypothetical protein
MGFCLLRTTVAAHRLWRRVALRALQPSPSADARGAHAKALANAASRCSIGHGRKHTDAKIHRQRFGHVSLCGTVERARHSAEGLGGHEIETVQPTAIDKEAGLIRRTIALAHSSGEWLSSEWTVGPIAETAQATKAGLVNRTWYERHAGRVVTDVQRWVQHPVHRHLAATLDGFVNDLDAVFEAKFMLPWSFSEEAAAEKHMAQLQHNMWVTNARSAALSIITGGANGSK